MSTNTTNANVDGIESEPNTVDRSTQIPPAIRNVAREAGATIEPLVFGNGDVSFAIRFEADDLIEVAACDLPGEVGISQVNRHSRICDVWTTTHKRREFYE